MLRWMISPIIGTGVFPDAFRAAVSDLSSVNSSAIIPTLSNGHPKYNFALCLVATASVATIAAVTNAYVFPDYNLDGRMDGMEAGTRTALKQSVEAYDIDGNGLHFDATNADSDSYRDLLTRIGQQIEPAFNVNVLNCGEVAG